MSSGNNNKLLLISALVLLGSILVFSNEESEEEFVKADTCNEEKCHLPDCRCSDSRYPTPEFEGFEDEIPQFVTVTFDDALTSLNFDQYQTLFEGLLNPDNCTALGTFFIAHEYTDYSKVNTMYTQGHEIALHSITHGTGTDYWRKADVDLIMREFGQQRQMLEAYAFVDKKDIRGMRLPFLQLSGNNTFIAAKNLGLEYDSSMPSQEHKDPPMYPYTLDYDSVQDCQIGPCPDVSIPGFWINPMVSWDDMEGYNCPMIDACYAMPEEEEDIFNWILSNFKRHYESNRAPFGMYLHSALFNRNENFFGAFRKFLEHVTTLPDAYITTISQVLEYMKNPVLGKPFEKCAKKPETRKCAAKSCSLRKNLKGDLRYMTICGKCPQVYPWLDNPMGLKSKLPKEKNAVVPKSSKTQK